MNDPHRQPQDDLVRPVRVGVPPKPDTRRGGTHPSARLGLSPDPGEVQRVASTRCGRSGTSQEHAVRASQQHRTRWRPPWTLPSPEQIRPTARAAGPCGLATRSCPSPHQDPFCPLDRSALSSRWARMDRPSRSCRSVPQRRWLPASPPCPAARCSATEDPLPPFGPPDPRRACVRPRRPRSDHGSDRSTASRHQTLTTRQPRAAYAGQNWGRITPAASPSLRDRPRPL